MAFLGRSPTPSPRFKPVLKDSDMGLREILKDLDNLDGQEIRIGVLKSKAQMTHPRSGQALGVIAKINEYGHGKTPERSFERSTFDRENRKWVARISRFMQRQSKRATFKEPVLDFSGNLVKKAIKKSIRSIKTPTNRPSTEARKGFNNPLIERRMLLRSIDYEKRSGVE